VSGATTPLGTTARGGTRRPRLAVWKFASCDGCQLSLLDCEDELLAVAQALEIAHFAEASSALGKGPYELSLVEGSITTEHDARRIRAIRRQSRRLVTIGACASAGGIQALRNFADVKEYAAVVYARPAYIRTLATSTPIAEHVQVDFELRGCPVDKHQLLEVITAFLAGRRPHTPAHSVCVECKLRASVCVTVARGTPCLGPVTHAGCGALCPAYDRGCYGCFGPMAAPNTASLAQRWTALGASPDAIRRAFRSFNAGAEAFRRESEAHEGGGADDAPSVPAKPPAP
jgi:sulfhydrogenase subunit delta